MSNEIERNNILTGRRLIPVTKWNHHHAWPPIGGLRHLTLYLSSRAQGIDRRVEVL
jgi:hypothetical protein